MNARYWPCSQVHSAESWGALDIIREVNLFFSCRGLYTMNVRYRVTLSEEERMALEEMPGKGRSQV